MTTSFLILKYALSKTGIIIIDPENCEEIECGYFDSDQEFIAFDEDTLHNWESYQKIRLGVYKKSSNYYYNHGPKSLEFVPNTLLGRGLALNYITYLEKKKLASMASELIIDDVPFKFLPGGPRLKKAILAENFIMSLAN